MFDNVHLNSFMMTVSKTILKYRFQRNLKKNYYDKWHICSNQLQFARSHHQKQNCQHRLLLSFRTLLEELIAKHIKMLMIQENNFRNALGELSF